MKNNRFKTLWGVALGLALLAAVPFAAFAGFGGIRGDSPKPDEVVIELYGTVRAKRTASFVFEGQTIQYKGDGSMYPNPPFRVNGVLWEDMNTPFQLNFTPDFENASILEQSGHSFELIKGKDSFTVSIKNIDRSNDKRYKVRIAAKYQKKRDDDKPKIIPAQEIKNPPALTTNGETVMYGPMMISGINEPTDGMDHPNYNVSSPVFPPNYYMGNKIEIKGMVDQKASFRLDGASIIYQNYTALPMGATGNNPVLAGGKFASGVTVNGKAWTNLAKPFGMNILDTGAFREINCNADNCSVSYSYHHKVIEITIANKGTEPTPFVITAFFADSHFD